MASSPLRVKRRPGPGNAGPALERCGWQALGLQSFGGRDHHVGPRGRGHGRPWWDDGDGGPVVMLVVG